jgi:acetyl-CoA C-acetyltransferase
MRMPDARTPVLVGVAQLNQRPDSLDDAREASALMTEVALAAAADAGAPRMLAAADLVVAINGAWSYRDPARIVADAVGASDARTVRTTHGGNTPQLVVDMVAEQIASGGLDVAVVVGAETIWSRRRLRSAGVERSVTEQPEGIAPDETWGPELDLVDPHEQARGLQQPVEVYPLFETAIRAQRGETVDAHRDRIAAMWQRFNEAAVANPYAWSRTAMTTEEIRDPSPANRMVAFPYTKAMCSNWDLDQAAALILCSVDAAERFGVARDRWVFVHGGAEAADTSYVSHRHELGRSPAIAAAWRALSTDRHAGVDDIRFLDVYSCFPSAVEAAVEAIGLDDSRPLTLTGGLTFAGGPLNNYVTHSIATLAGCLRSDPDALGLVTANGGLLTKHALGLYAGHPPKAPFRRTALSLEEVPHQAREAAREHVGPVTLEASTVMHDRSGPTQALFAGITPDGRRAWGTSTDADVMQAAMTTELADSAADLDADGCIHLS